MVRLVALVISIILQIIAGIIAFRFMKLTNNRLSWILLSLSFSFMAVRKIIQFFAYFRGAPSYTWQMFDEWLGVVVSIFIVSGVILIRELFMSLKKAEIERKRSENNVIIAIINTEEEERKRFAKDLHDGLGPILSTVKMSLSALTGKIKDRAGIEILANSNHLINEGITAIKEISNNLSPHVLSNFGLVSAINAVATKINKTKSIKIDFKSNMENQRLNNDKEVVIYRAVCELINNSIRHSKASQIDIELNKHEKNVTLQFNDNGKGFNASIHNNEYNNGMGLSNINARVRSVEGIFILESIKGKGTNALIKITE